MNNKNNNIRNVFMRNTKTYNKHANKNNMTEKNNIIFIKNNNNVIKSHNSRENSKSIKNSQKKLNYKKIYNNENKKMMHQENTLILENISKTNAVNIQNINLISSMNNITVFDSSLENDKKDLLKKPINVFNSHKIFGNNHLSIDYNNTKNNLANKNNILVNKKKKLSEYQTPNENVGNSGLKNDKIKSISKKSSYKEFNCKKNNKILNNFKSFNNNNKYSRGNNYSNFNKKDSKNDNNEIMLNTEENLSVINNRNNSINKSTLKETNTNKTDFSLFNTCSNYTNSMGDEELNEHNSKMLLIDKMNDKHNVINVNKLNPFKMNVSNMKNSNDNTNNNSNYKSNVINMKTSPNSSNILGLLSNKNIHNGNKKIFDKEYLNKLKKNIIKDKLHKTKSKDSLKIIKKPNTKTMKNLRNIKKTKSEEKNSKKNKDNNTNMKKKNLDNNQDIIKRIKLFSSFFKDNNRKNNNSNIDITKRLGHTYLNDMYTNYDNNTYTFNESMKYFYPNLNSDNNNTKNLNLNGKKTKKNAEYPNRIKYYGLNQENNEKNTDNIPDKENYNQNKFETEIYEKIEVNKKKLPQKKLSHKIQINPLNKKSAQNILDHRNKSINFYSQKLQPESTINNQEQTNSFYQNFDNNNYCCLSNCKVRDKKKEKFKKIVEITRKKSAPKTNTGNIIYNKKQLLCYSKKGKMIENKIISPDNRETKISFRELTDDFSHNNNNIFDDETSFNFIGKKNDIRIKSPTNTIYKKPARNINNNQNYSIVNAKDTYHNKLLFYTNKVLTHENRKSSSKKKKQFNIKLNKFIAKNGLSDDNNNNDKNNNVNNINTNSVNYNEEMLIRTKESIMFNSINTYKTIKHDLSSISNNNETSKSKEYMINSEQFSFKKVTQKTQVKNSFVQKYYCYFIEQKYNKEECFITKIRLNKNNFIIYEIPTKKICYYSKKRKIFVKTIPKVEICYYKKDLIIINNNEITNTARKLKSNRKNRTIKEYAYINKKEVENIDKYNFQYSFTSLNSNEHNISDNSNNYFEISFGRKSNKFANNECFNKINNNEKLL